MTAHLLLLLLFVMTIILLIVLKLCSTRLDHRATPLFISFWTIVGLLAVTPFYGHLWDEGFAKMQASPLVLVFAVIKGISLYWLFVISQELTEESLSSRHYVTPMSVGLIALSNFFLGEHLSVGQSISAAGLCLLSVGFFFKGHLSDLSVKGKVSYAKLVALAVFMASLDHVLTRDSNWYTLMWVSNAVLFVLSLGLNIRKPDILRAAFLNRYAICAGIFYAATDLVKFYQQVSINPVSVVIMVQSMTKPVILVLSALIWKERTVREQLIWGAAAFLLVILPFFYPAG